jgi:hypothetical protein
LLKPSSGYLALLEKLKRILKGGSFQLKVNFLVMTILYGKVSAATYFAQTMSEQ